MEYEKKLKGFLKNSAKATSFFDKALAYCDNADLIYKTINLNPDKYKDNIAYFLDVKNTMNDLMDAFNNTAGKVPLFGEIFSVYYKAFNAFDGVVQFTGSYTRTIDKLNSTAWNGWDNVINHQNDIDNAVSGKFK